MADKEFQCGHKAVFIDDAARTQARCHHPFAPEAHKDFVTCPGEIFCLVYLNYIQMSELLTMVRSMYINGR